MHIVIILGIAALLAVAGTLYYRTDPVAEVYENTETEIVETVETNETSDATADGYADGTYAATGTYRSPAGEEGVDITVTLKDDVVTAATFTGKATHPTSKLNQEKFNAGFAALVVGKPLDAINLTVVNGSSLTPKGFMDALAEVKAEARS